MQLASISGHAQHPLQAVQNFASGRIVVESIDIVFDETELLMGTGRASSPEFRLANVFQLLSEEAFRTFRCGSDAAQVQIDDHQSRGQLTFSFISEIFINNAGKMLQLGSFLQEIR